MSIEKLLTLGVAAGLLVIAAILRLLVLGALSLLYKLSGREIPRAASDDDPRPARQRRPLARPALHGLGVVGGGLVYVLATLGAWTAVAGGAIARSATAAYARLSPRVTAGTKTGLTAAAAKIKSFAIVTVATALHLGRTLAQMVNERLAQRSADRAAQRAAEDAAAEEPQGGRVIRLEREWDPLTDPLEDEPASNYR